MSFMASKWTVPYSYSPGAHTGPDPMNTTNYQSINQHDINICSKIDRLPA